MPITTAKLFASLLLLAFLVTTATPFLYAAEKKKVSQDVKPSQKEQSPKAQPVLEIIRTTPDFSTFAVALRKAGMEKTLEGMKDHTLFLPSNDAFAALPEGTLERLFGAEGQKELAALLSRHILKERVELAALENGIKNLEPLAGEALAFDKKGLDITVSGAHVIQADLPAANGLIHVVDRVLLPQ